MVARFAFPIIAPPSTLATVTVVNKSGSIQVADFISPMFGHPFKKGDVASGDWPLFQTSGGATVPFSYGGKTTWSDGSWKFASFTLRVPISIAGSGTID